MTRPRTIVLVLAAATATYLTAFSLTVQGQSGATEAPAGFDNLTNGFESRRSSTPIATSSRSATTSPRGSGRSTTRRAAPSAIRIR